MTNSEIITIVSIVSALTSTTLVTYFNYKFGLKSKKFDVLFSNQLSAFKEVSNKVTLFKNFCVAKIAYENANEFSPFYEEGFGALYHRTEIATALSSNSIFLSKISKREIDDLLTQMSGLCSGEAILTSEASDLNLVTEYKRMETISENAIKVLRHELQSTKYW